MDFTEIGIQDKDLIDSYLKIFKSKSSEFSFTNLFIWRHYFKFRFAIINDLLCIISFAEETKPFCYMPIGIISEEKLKKTIIELGNYFKKNNWKLQFNKIEENCLDYFKSYVSSEEDMVMDRDNSDYIYLTQDMINLSGKKYDGKRNHIKRFNREYKFEYVSIDSTNIHDCEKILKEWCIEHNCKGSKSLEYEKLANNDLLEQYEKLGCKGALIYVNGKAEAFTIGENFNDDTALILVEKATSNIKGLYTIINQQFCENQWKDLLYINREEDMGIEGMRKAKLSYHPVFLINKYTVKINMDKL